MIRVHIRNDDPVWARYGLTVDLDDDSLSDAEARELALEQACEGNYEVASGPDMGGDVIAGMDQQYEVGEIERNAQPAPAPAPAPAESPTWNFWLPDEDRSSGWTNHCYVLQFVCAGKGDTPDEAWESAKRGEIKDLAFPRDAFELPDTVVAIRDDAEHKLEVA